jgi:hypothetical protein
MGWFPDQISLGGKLCHQGWLRRHLADTLHPGGYSGEIPLAASSFRMSSALSTASVADIVVELLDALGTDNHAGGVTLMKKPGDRDAGNADEGLQ